LTSRQLTLIDICVHYLNSKGRLVNYILGLPKLYSAHSSNNIVLVVAATLRAFNVDKQRVRYFVLNNAYNNNTAVAYLASKFSFYKA
jgi:hypothetical protein